MSAAGHNLPATIRTGVASSLPASLRVPPNVRRVDPVPWELFAAWMVVFTDKLNRPLERITSELMHAEILRHQVPAGAFVGGMERVFASLQGWWPSVDDMIEACRAWQRDQRRAADAATAQAARDAADREARAVDALPPRTWPGMPRFARHVLPAVPEVLADDERGIPYQPAVPERAGGIIDRVVPCKVCGHDFTQSQVAADWLAALDYAARKVLDAAFPDGWIPDLCGACCRRADDAVRHVPLVP